MKFFDLKGRRVSKDVSKYLIDWTKDSRSKFQSTVKFQLQPFWKRHIVYEEFPVVGSRMTLDFVNLTLRVAIEVQGRQHSEFTPFFHGDDRLNFGDQLFRDSEKLDWCNNNGILLVEIHPEDLPITKKFLQINKLL